MVATLSGQYHLSKRQIEALLFDFFGVSIGLSSVVSLEQATSEALKPVVAEVHAGVKAAGHGQCGRSVPARREAQGLVLAGRHPNGNDVPASAQPRGANSQRTARRRFSSVIGSDR